ncbi:hypothetical protein G1C96_0478 [Bifidobacterium sp. DSM 109958]|uniref:CRESS-DNA virus Rep endonuclease domain-containing protein n=1 Tax=Bifidobacterium moraviense TaxID=2675323 RepID=A0A7Y0HX45_9BIFI|nr:hypothetical protein [Bifidobacterium sp. DSM 109958]NMM99900.1 hypothetical protein [Bifidobacterium sp. DSM 109958]
MVTALSDGEIERRARGIEARQKLQRDQRVNTWLVTLNNPGEHVPECAGLDPEQTCRMLLSLFLTNRKGERRKSRGAAVCYERGLKEGTDHVHMLISFTGRGGAPASTLVRLFPDATIEPMRGTVDEAMAYLSKTGKHASKEETTVVPPIVDGDPIRENPKSVRGRGGDEDPTPLDLMRDAIMSGTPLEEIRSDPRLGRVYASHIKYVHELRSDYEHKRAKGDREVTCWYVWGGSRLGKTHAALDYWRSVRGRDDVYRVTDWLNPFDGYKGESVLICDEFNGQLPCTALNPICEGYEGTQAHARYQNAVPAWDTVVFISNRDLDDLYVGEAVSVRNAFRQRFGDRVRHVTRSWRDPGYENPWPAWVAGETSQPETDEPPLVIRIPASGDGPNITLVLHHPKKLVQFIATQRFATLSRLQRELLAYLYELMRASGWGR